MPDIYSDPESFGLEVFATLYEPNMSYEFNMFAVWIDRENRKLFYGSDSGCSCPSPFEKVQCIQELNELKNLKAFEDDLHSWGDSFLDAQEISSIIDEVRVAIMYKCMLP